MFLLNSILVLSAARFALDLWHGSPLGETVNLSLCSVGIAPSVPFLDHVPALPGPLAQSLQRLKPLVASVPFAEFIRVPPECVCVSERVREQCAQCVRTVCEEVRTRYAESARNAQFWSRALRIYSSYKLHFLAEGLRSSIEDICARHTLTDMHNGTTTPLLVLLQPRRGENATVRLQRLHELNSARTVDLCLSLRGFYLKAGQFLGTRHDLLSSAYTSRLSRLHDDVPALPAARVRSLLERELGGDVEAFFERIDLASPVGSASVAQVHRAVWRATREEVAVKVQNPDAERFMRDDLRNLERLARFLRRTELRFDLVSAVQELQSQIALEFDFRREAAHMDSVGPRLVSRVSGLRVPRSIFRTKRLLVMSFLQGESLAKLRQRQQQLEKEKEQEQGQAQQGVWSAAAKRRTGKKLLSLLATVWAEQIFVLGKFHADPHPGNLCLDQRSGTVGLLDWGQVKELPLHVVRAFAEMILAVDSGDQDRVVRAFSELGIVVQHAEDKHSVEALARTMFDTKSHRRFHCDPLHRNDNKLSPLHANRVRVVSMPRDVFFLLRTVQMIRGLASGFGITDFSLAKKWRPYAKTASRKPFRFF